MRLQNIASAVPFLILLFCHCKISVYAATAYLNSSEYSEGLLGQYPLQTFRSTEVKAPQINQIRHSERCNQKLHTFLTPHSNFDGQSNWQATILDNEGNLVWTSPWNGQSIYNLMVQTYRGQQVLTLWAGDAAGGIGSGAGYILDSAYNVIECVGCREEQSVRVDLHEFTITPDNTVLTTAYVPIHGDTTRPLWDCVLQEIDIHTGEYLFQWSALDHVNLEDSHIDHKAKIPGSDLEHSDWFHMNSIDKDSRGNYLVCSAFTYSIYYIDGTNGNILWILGGKRNMFEDKSSGQALNFSGQHTARWSEEHNMITLFNNDIAIDESQPRGMRLAIDQDAMTVELLDEYTNPWDFRVDTQGSMQDLPNGNVLLGFGSEPAYTEFSHAGEPLCETHFAPATNFGHFTVQSYRVLKFAWQGCPSELPAVNVSQENSGGPWQVFVSWNGATEVKRWILQETDDEEVQDESWNTVETKAKIGFETSFIMNTTPPIYVRVLAEGEERILGTSEAARVSTAAVGRPTLRPQSQNEIEDIWILPVILVFATISTAIGIIYCSRPFPHQRLATEPDNASTGDRP